MKLNIKEANDWLIDNTWMVLFWIMQAKRVKGNDKMQEFAEESSVELNKTNVALAGYSPFAIFNNLFASILRSVVFNKENKFPVYIEGYYSKFGKFPKVDDVQLYYADLKQADDKSSNPLQRLYHNNISVMLDWKFKSDS